MFLFFGLVLVRLDDVRGRSASRLAVLRLSSCSKLTWSGNGGYELLATVYLFLPVERGMVVLAFVQNDYLWRAPWRRLP